MTIPVPKGYRLAGVHCRIKRDPQKNDLVLVVSGVPAVAAGVYTQNVVHSATVALDRSRTPSDRIRAVVINSGVANACTGRRGMEDARKMAALAAAACGAEEDQALVMSTGVIGEFLPMKKIEQGIASAAGLLGSDEESLLAAARGMMTTDTVPKLAGRTVEPVLHRSSNNELGATAVSAVPLRKHGQDARGTRQIKCDGSPDRHSVQITGMAKGAAMIGPNMATMLTVILTDATLDPTAAQDTLAAAVDESFNCISVEGHTSTSDTALLLANGASDAGPLTGEELAAFRLALGEVCVELARAIIADGEGATHLITVEVAGCADAQSARRIAKTISNSALVKTAVAGADPNWGRIVSAAGYAGVPFNPEEVGLRVNGMLLYQGGAPVDFDAEAVSDSIRTGRDVLIQLRLSEGDLAARFWTTDLTAEYIRLNANYHT